MTETVYSRAADLIYEAGWTQANVEGDGLHQAISHNGLCVHLALVHAVNDLRLGGSVLTGAKAAVCAHLGVRGLPDVWHWNDAPPRTVEDVLLVLKELHVETMEAGR